MTDIVPGNLFIVAAPSGGGKTSLVSWLVNNVSNIVVSVSHTTRPMRPGEKDLEDYYFVSDPVFLRMVEEEAFIEHARVFSHWYGTSIAEIQQRLQNGVDVILDIDWQGAQQIKHRFKEAIGIFIIPPSLDALKERLQNRQQDDASVIANRMELARNEVSHYTEFDYLIVNDDFEEASKELQAIIMVQRLRIQQQLIAQRKLLSFLLSAQ